jgi:hypothetical protein
LTFGKTGLPKPLQPPSILAEGNKQGKPWRSPKKP